MWLLKSEPIIITNIPESRTKIQLVAYTTNDKTLYFSFLKDLNSKESKADRYLDQMHKIYHEITNTKWTHHHRKHATLVDKAGHFHHTQHNSSIFSSNWYFQYLVYYSFHSICKQLLQIGHSTLHQFLGVVETVQTTPSLLQTLKSYDQHQEQK